MTKDKNVIPIIVAVIGSVAVLGSLVVANSDKLFPSSPPAQSSNEPIDPAQPSNPDAALDSINPDIVAIGKIVLGNLDKTQNTGSDFDYWPEGGIQIAYFHLATFLTYKELSELSPHPIFLSGPHNNGDLALNSRFTFGRYNPEFLRWFQDHLEAILQDKNFVAATEQKFKAYLGRTLMTYWETYNALSEHPDELNLLLQDYQERIENRSLPEAYYYNLAWEESREKYQFIQSLDASPNNYDTNVIAPAVYFWLRRHIDGTHQQMFSILDSLLRSYNTVESRLYYNPDELP